MGDRKITHFVLLTQINLTKMKKNLLAALLVLTTTYAKSQIVISGYMSNPIGADKNLEYMQFLATEDIDFSAKNFAVVVSKNSTAATPNPGEPAAKGWATGGDRTYKFNLTKGSVKKGDLFYVGARKLINGAKSTDISNAKWISSKNYSDEAGDDFGNASGSLFPNSGRAAGIAVFATKDVSVTTVPIDVIFFQTSGGGVLWDGDKGYLISDNDLYNTKDSRYFRGEGKNKATFKNAGEEDTSSYFTKLGGVYDATNKSWSKSRDKDWALLTEKSVLSDIETNATKLK